MKNTQKPHEEDTANSSSSLNRLPDEIILQILTILLDLKTLCYCHLVSRRFSSIVLQIDTISFTAPLLTPPNSDSTTTGDLHTTGFPDNLYRSLLNGVVFKPIHLLRRIVYGDSFRSALSFLSTFKGLKSLSIELPSSTHRGIDNNNCLFKWKVKLGNRIESFLFVSPNSIDSIPNSNDLYVKRNVDEVEEIMEQLSVDSFKRKVHIAFQCLKDVIVRHRMMLYFIKEHPHLEKVSILDSGRRGTLSLSGDKLAEVREWMNSEPQLNRIEVPVNVSQCYVPVLKLPVSGCVMSGVALVVMQMDNVQYRNDCFVIGEDGFEDEVEAAYSEAVMEILKNHKDKM